MLFRSNEKATPLKELPSPKTADPCPFYYSIESAELNNKRYGVDAVEEGPEKFMDEDMRSTGRPHILIK